MENCKALSNEERELLGTYFKENYADMLDYATYLLHNRSLAEVATQEAFIIAAHKIDEFRSSANPVGWLYRALQYNVRHAKRDQQQVIKRMISYDTTAGLDEQLPDASSEMPLPQTLDPKRNEHLWLLNEFYVVGRDIEELAAELGISAPALKMRIYRAKIRLRKDPEIQALKNF